MEVAISLNFYSKVFTTGVSLTLLSTFGEMQGGRKGKHSHVSHASRRAPRLATIHMSNSWEFRSTYTWLRRRELSMRNCNFRSLAGNWSGRGDSTIWLVAEMKCQESQESECFPGKAMLIRAGGEPQKVFDLEFFFTSLRKYLLELRVWNQSVRRLAGERRNFPRKRVLAANAFHSAKGSRK